MGLYQASHCWYIDLYSKLVGNEFLEVEGTTCVCTHKHVYTDLPIFTETKKIIKLIKSIYEEILNK